LTSVKESIESANEVAVSRMMDSEPTWVDVGTARAKIPGMKKTILHAGPPITWRSASGPLKGAVIGAILYEGWAEDATKAERLVEEGEVAMDCTHHYNVVGPMAGVISPGMPVYELKEDKYGTRTYSIFNEGIGKVLRYGAYNREVLKRLKWIGETFAPVLKAAIRRMAKETGGLPLKPIIAQALTMGDDCHNRYNAATSLMIRQTVPHMISTGFGRKQLAEAARFMNDNNFTALNLGMAASKAMTLAAHDIKHSTIVTAMARNGTDAGIWVSGLGKKWFTTAAPVPKGLWFPGFSEKDANPDIGDSAITETAGFGGFAMAAAPAIVSWVGGNVQSAIEVTNRMYQITQTMNKHFLIPFLDFKGTPTGIDIRKVLKTGIPPTLNTGIAHRNAGVGQVGAGTVSFPIAVFKDALRAYAEKYGV
jgi:hypothetical protein